MNRNAMIWEKSLSNYYILGSCSPATFEPKVKQLPEKILHSSAAVFVDVLRATTTLVAVGASDCKGIVVDRKPLDGVYLFKAPFYEDQEWVFGGEYNGNPITGIDSAGQEQPGVIGNSPLTVKPSVFKEKYLRFFSTNGAQAFNALAKAKFASIFALSLANIEATAQALLASKPDRIWLVGGGFYGGSTIEDSVAAGFLIKRLIQLEYTSREKLDDEAETMRIYALHFEDGKEFLEYEFFSRLKNAQVSKLLTDLGHEKDVKACMNGSGMEKIWNDMKDTALVCKDMDKRLLVPEKQNLVNLI